VSGTSQFGANSGHAIAVYDLNGDGSMTKAYAYGIIGYPQTSAMVTTAYAGEDGYVYIYLPYNYTPGGISVLKDRPGQTAPLTTTNSGYSEVFTPAAPLAQYCICSTIADQYGTLYYKNDSCYMMAITSKIESLEITQYPTITENEDGTLTVDGLKAVTKLRNGEERDVSKYVSVTKNEQTG
ncbi:dockerin type I repeat protein, partial [human gut metagenome]